MIKVGIIGGTGLEDPDIISSATNQSYDTPYGKPSSDLLFGKINGTEVVLLSRHGRSHTIPPTQVNNRANIHALKEVGCTHLLVTTACGSLREEIQRGDIVFLDQFINLAFRRDLTFFDSFDPHNLRHTPMATPFDEHLRHILIAKAQELNLRFHPTGTVVTIEGPRFSTRAESNMFRQWGADVINMSTAPEAILANEIGLPYAAIAMSTDYDCWKTDESPVTWEEVINVFRGNVSNVIGLIVNTLKAME